MNKHHMENKEYFYLDGETRVGPISLSTLKKASISPTTMIWNYSLPNWVEARTIPELAEIFAPANTPSPSSSSSTTNYGTNFNTEKTSRNTSRNTDRKPPVPDSYLAYAIVSTIYCCFPFGIASIVYASKVVSTYIAGDYTGAKQASENAKKWAIWAAIAGGVFWTLYLLFFVILGITTGFMDTLG